MKNLLRFFILLIFITSSTVYADVLGDYEFTIPDTFSKTSEKANQVNYQNDTHTVAIRVEFTKDFFSDTSRWDEVVQQIYKIKIDGVKGGLIVSSSEIVITNNPATNVLSFCIDDEGRYWLYELTMFYDDDTLDVYTIELMHYVPTPFNDVNYLTTYGDFVKSFQHVEDSNESKKTENDVSPELIEEMEAYKKFFEKYIDFMKTMSDPDSTNSLEILGEYSDVLSEYQKSMDALNNYDTSNMSEADRKYYTNTMIEIEQMLLEGLKQ